jgi:cardiolipin synthase
MAPRVWTVPNQITFLRLGFIPLFIILIDYERYGWALAVLIAAGLTDGIDGLLARRLNQKSPLGAILDPIADKLLLSSSFFILALKGKIHWWLAILVLSRDLLLLITAAVIILVAGYRPFPPSIYGKWTTTFQIFLVFGVVLAATVEQPWLVHVNRTLTLIVAALTVFSGFHYGVINAHRLSSSEADRPGHS